VIDMDKVRLNITLPSDIARELFEITRHRKRSQFIAEALRLRIEQLKDKKQKALLKEGYMAEKEASLAMTKEFEACDMESWDAY
jgi:metal-responsive CopG/Arc/MetJ family transcriptional regulator